MPTYTYKREDGSRFEIQQKITADALETCPTTGQAVTRVITGGAGLVFKGTGFYETDYVKKSGAPESKSTTKKSNTGDSTKATPSASSDSTGKDTAKKSSD